MGLTFLILPLFLSCPNQKILICTKVIDGDTIVLSNAQKVILIGVDTPETKHPQKLVEYYGKETTAFTNRMVGGKGVKLECDRGRRYKYRRPLPFVFIQYDLMLVY